MAMANRSNNVLTEEWLAAAEEVCRTASACGLLMESLYHGSSGDSAIRQSSAEETKNWLI